VRRHLTYSNVAATLALVIAIAGGTTAIGASKAPKNSVASSSIKPYNVTAGDLAGIRVASAFGQFKVVATCRSGERLLSGGGSSPGGIGSSSPENNGWSVEQASGSGNLPVSAFALCLKAKPGK
jgi:hypothetical protein